MKLSKDTQTKLDTVEEIIKYVEYVGTVTAENISNVIFNNTSEAYTNIKVKPLLEALVLTGKLNKCKAAINTFYSIAK